MDPTAQTESSTSRWGPAAGVASAALLLYALLGPPWPPEGDAPAAVWQAHLANPGNRLWLLAGTLAATVAGVLFVTFMASLRQRGLLARGGGLATLGYGCGLLFVMSVFATFCAWVTVPAGIQISGEPVPSGELIRFFNDLGQAFLAIPAPLCAGAFAMAVATDAGRTHAIPQWLATAGIVVGIAQLGGIFFFPLLLFPAWVATVAAALLWAPSRHQHTTAVRAEPTP
jgi:hypothetical protein